MLQSIVNKVMKKSVKAYSNGFGASDEEIDDDSAELVLVALPQLHSNLPPIRCVHRHRYQQPPLTSFDHALVHHFEQLLPLFFRHVFTHAKLTDLKREQKE